MRQLGCFSLIFLLGSTCAPLNGGLRAAQLVRGPYLQAATSDGVTVRWRTDVPTGSVVMYGTHSSDFPPASDPTPTTEHAVRLSGLSPATRYSIPLAPRQNYLPRDRLPVCNDSQAGQAVSTRVWIVGDSGGLSYGETNVLAMRDGYYAFARTRRADVWLLLGDNAYEDGTDDEYQANFFTVFSPMLRQVAAWPTIGNMRLTAPTPPVGSPI